MRKNRTKRRTRRRRRMRGGFMGLSIPKFSNPFAGLFGKKEEKDPIAAAAVPAAPVDEPAGPVGPAGPESTAPAAEPSEEYPSKMGGRRRKRKRKTKKKRGGGCGCAGPDCDNLYPADEGNNNHSTACEEAHAQCN